VYHHVSATWDEPSLEEKKRAMGFQVGTTNHTKVTRLERNALLGKGMDLNSFTWLLVTCVVFQMYTTLVVLMMQPHGTSTKYTCLFSTLYISLLVLGGKEVPCNLTQVVFNTPRGTLASGKIITTFYEIT